MFRRLFAIETEALHSSADALDERQEPVDTNFSNNLRDLARFASMPSRHGMWSSRAAY